jgi:MprA protease rhombosortase-interaction domain-containing protein
MIWTVAPALCGLLIIGGALFCLRRHRPGVLKSDDKLP